MKKYSFLVVFLILLGACLVWNSPARAQEEPSEYAYGTVASIGTDKLLVVEYDYGQDTEVEKTYLFDSQVQLKNVSSINEILVGDNVEIDYFIQGGNRVAQTISVEKSKKSENEIKEEENNSSAAPAAVTTK